MTYPITYIVQKGDTLTSVAKKHNISDWNRLRLYHNNNCPLNDQIGDKIYVGEKLLIPEPDKEPVADDVVDQNAQKEEKAEAKKEEEKKKTADEEKKKEAEKGPHDGKFYVVHGATCVCDQAEVPTKTAKIQVTSHKQLVINDEDGKFAVTEDDKTLDPPAMTFGKCKLKPSNSGNLPCAPVLNGKWEKTYEKNTVKGKTLVTEISTLHCSEKSGGTITIKKHGQKNSVTQQHADNTDPVEQILINPAVNKPVEKPAYPAVKFITLKTITARTSFVEVNSNDKAAVEKVKARLNEQCTFTAKLGTGNKDLTSWVIYGTSGEDKGKKLFVREQTGTTFQNAFLKLGTYRIEGYGKPKKPEFDKGANDKNYPSCSIDVEVITNHLEGDKLLAEKGGSFTRFDENTKKVKLRQGFPATFKPHFVIDPNEAEIEQLKMYALDESGNVLSDGLQTGAHFTFTPANTKAIYTILAEYTNPDGTISKQSFKGLTEGNAVLSITHNAEVIRPGTPMSFSVDKTRYVALVKKDSDLIVQEVKQVKWALNGVLIGTGRSIIIPGSMLTIKQKYVIEAYVSEANATGKGTKNKDEEDDWRFEVKDNDVESFICVGQPKVGKKTQITVSKLSMPLIAGETINWEAFGLHINNTSTIHITPPKAGIHGIKCWVNQHKGVRQTIDVKQAVINDVMFTDSSGLQIEKASWGQKVNIWVNQKYLTDETLDIAVWDDDSASGDDSVWSKSIPSYDGGLIPFALDANVQKETGSHGSLYVKIQAPYVKALHEGVEFPKTYKLDVDDVKEIYSAEFADQDGKLKHTKVDYDKVSTFFAHTRGFKKDEEVTIEIWESVFGKDKDLNFHVKTKIDSSGLIKCDIHWNKIPKIKTMRTVYAQIRNKEGDIMYDADGNELKATVYLVNTPTLTKIAGYKSAVVVGSSAGGAGGKDNKNGVCEAEARVRAFMRMLRVGEGTGEVIKSYDYKNKKTVYIPHDFDKGYTTAYNGNKITDLSTHPQIVYNGDSSAAGAYQVMRYTWWEISGFEVIKKKKTGKYNVKDDLLKKRNITDYKSESQDKICLVIMERQRPKMINKIIKNNIELAINEEGCFIWASLPEDGEHSHYKLNGKLQPATPIKTCLEHYNTFLKEELAGKSPLNLKKGFLKEFGYDCCDKESKKPTDCSCKKVHIDLRDKIVWHSQFDSQWGTKSEQNVACWKASQQILTNSGLGSTSGYPSGAIQLAKEIDKHTKMDYFPEGLKAGIKYIDEELEKNHPILVGVNHDLNYRKEKNSDHTTDHFVVIVGRNCDDNGAYYLFYEVGTSYKKSGASDDNKLYVLTDRIEGKTAYSGSKLYQIAQVRKNK
jgi:muramidase (phage lysozyme)